MGYCCVPCCKSTQTKGLSFHKFPTSIESKRLWIIAISRQGNPRSCQWTPKGRSTVCSKHFKDSDYSVSTTKKILLPNAVPSVFEDLVSRKRRWRLRVPFKSKSEMTESTEASHSNLSDSENHAETDDQQLSTKEKMSKKCGVVSVSGKGTGGSVWDKLAESRDYSDLSYRDEGEMLENANEEVPLVEEPPESAVDHSIEEISDNSTFAEEILDASSECGNGRNENNVDTSISRCSTTIKISKSLQLVLQTLVTTIEDQRAEISKLKRERELLNRKVYELKKQQTQHCMVHHTKNLGSDD